MFIVARVKLFLRGRVSRVCAEVFALCGTRVTALVPMSVFIAGALHHAASAAEPPSLESDTTILERMQRAFGSLVEHIAPSVVAIHTVHSKLPISDDTTAASLRWGTTGSGIIIREDGMILTSQHVIDRSGAIRVTLHDGRRLSARLVAADPRSDLAVIRIEAADLAVASLGDAGSVRRGHIVLAVGNPLGLAGDGQVAVSQGIVSAMGRPLPVAFGRGEDRYYGDMIQTTARVTSGSSGGPLIDIHGKVIGVVTVVGLQGDVDGALGFAVPIGSHAKAIIDKLLRGQSIDYGYLGVEVGDPTGAQWRAAGLASRRGAVVVLVVAGGAADRANLKKGDIIVAIEESEVRSADHFIRVIGSVGPGRKARISYMRGSNRQQATVELAKREAPAAIDQPLQRVEFRGATLVELDPITRNVSNLPGPALLVLIVEDGSLTAHAGLTPGDLVVRIQGQPVTLNSAVELGELTGNVLLGLSNGGSVLVKAE